VTTEEKCDGFLRKAKRERKEEEWRRRGKNNIPSTFPTIPLINKFPINHLYQIVQI
jgi:hypothetical protein